LNFVAKFDGSLPAGIFSPKAQAHSDTVSTKAPADAIIVQDAQLLFTGDFKRTGVDLVISKDGHELLLADYFKSEKRAPLASSDGAYLTGKIVDALTGHVQVAQADGSASAAKIIGHVTKLTGNATVVRNGVSIILNNGDNVYQGDVVQAGSNSSLGITFIDGSVFGLASNAKMVLNEMIYDPNGSSNSSLLSLVQGTISFVAGATAKHGDMKVDTPVATMGIRGTAVLVEIDFEVPATGSAPPARFQVLVEPDGTTGSYVLLDRTTLAPIASVNQAGTVTSVTGQGVVSFLSSAQLSPEAMKLINEVFTQKFTDNSNPRSDTHFTDAPVPTNTFPVKFAGGDGGSATIHVVYVQDKAPAPNSGPTNGLSHIPGPPEVHAFNEAFSERTLLTGSSLLDTVTGHVNYLDINVGDTPTMQTKFGHFAYRDAAGNDITATLTPEQLAAIAAVTVPLQVQQDPNQRNYGTATWTYSVLDQALDFLAAGETLTLTYMARVDNNFLPYNEWTEVPFTITITGTNDLPTISATSGAFTELPGTGNSTIDHVGGTITFADVDLTDRPVVTTAFHSFSYQDAQHNDITATLTPEQLAAITATEAALTLTPAASNTHDGTVGWSYDVPDYVFDFLAEGETLTLTYSATVDDGHGGVVTVPITVTITGAGTNDIPTIAVTNAAFTELANPDQPNPVHSTTPHTATGTITFTDVDLTDRPMASAEFTSFTYTDAAHNPLTLTAAEQSAIAAVEVPLTVTQVAGNTNNGSANWTYKLPDGAFDFLAAGEILALTYTATVDDGHGGVVTAPFTITITGTNDTPVITSTAQTGSIQEISDTTGSTVSDMASGTLTFTDVDLTDTHSVTITGVSAAGATTGLADNETVLKWLELGAFSDSTDGATGSQVWSFSAQDHHFDYLAEGEQLTLTYTVQVDDGHGGIITTPVEITVTGTNDAPVVTSTAQTGSIQELTDTTDSTASDMASGTVTFTDVDLTDTHSVTITGVSAAGVTTGLADNETVLKWLELGAFSDSTDGATGSQVWSFSAQDHHFDYLADGEQLTLTYTVQVDDGHGGVITTPVEITVTGTNDAPVVTSTAQTATIQEIADTTGSTASDMANGTVTFTDVDLTDTHSVTITGVSAAGATTGLADNETVLKWLELGAFSDSTDGATGSQVWSFSAPDHYFDYLADGQQVTLTYTVQVDDGHGGVITTPVEITITGTNDAASIVGETNPAAIGVMVVDPIIIEPAGTNFNSLGLNTETFNSRTAGSASNNGAGTGNFTSSALGATFLATGHAGIVHGSSSVSAAPFMGPLPGSQDNTNYLSIGAGATETITFATDMNTFGLYWGSVDSYNTIKFYEGTTLVASYTGADIAPLLANGNQSSFTANGYVEFIDLPAFNKVVLGTSNSNAFEIDNISAGNLPPPHAEIQGTVAGTMSVHDPDIGDTLTGVVTTNATALYNGSTTLPNGINVSDLIKAGNITFDSVQSDGGTDILHWTYDPHGASFDFLHPGDTLTLTYTAQVNDGHGNFGSQQLTITLVGTDNETNLSTFKLVEGTTGNDTFNNIGGNATLHGNGGHDNFVFKPGGGSATIADFDPASDTITFASSMFNHDTAAVLAAAHDDGHGNTVIALGAADTITLQHVLKAQLSASDFHFV